MQDKLVLLETALLAKEKGFNWICNHYYAKPIIELTKQEIADKFNIDVEQLIIKQLEASEQKVRSLEISVANLIKEITGIEGSVDCLSGDGVSFTTGYHGDVHISVEQIIEALKRGEVVNEEYINENSAF